jgi:hypothetical protein
VEGALTETPPPVLTPPENLDGGAGPTTTDDVDHGVIRDVSVDPRGGPDKALAAAYEIVTKPPGTAPAAR